MSRDATDSLRPFEIPPVLVAPMIRMLRLGNTAVDTLFYVSAKSPARSAATG